MSFPSFSRCGWSIWVVDVSDLSLLVGLSLFLGRGSLVPMRGRDSQILIRGELVLSD
jgi:hypothetical protein